MEPGSFISEPQYQRPERKNSDISYFKKPETLMMTSQQIPIIDPKPVNIKYGWDPSFGRRFFDKMGREFITFNKIDTYGNAIPLGSFCYAVAFIIYGFYRCKVYKVNDTFLWSIIFLFGGIGQTTAGFLEYLKGRSFPSSLYLTYGFYCLSHYAMYTIPSWFYINKNNSFIYNFSENSICAFYSGWVVLSFGFILASANINYLYTAQCLTAFAFFLLRSIGEGVGSLGTKRNAAGILQAVSGFFSLIICFSQILNIATYQKGVIPTCPGQEQNGIDIYYNKCCAPKLIIDSGRKSNVEFLRIFAALGVIVLHYNNPKIGGGFEYAKNGGWTQNLMLLTESIFICAVNVYVLISGYFMRKSMKRDLLKPLELLVQLIVFEMAFCIIKSLAKGNRITFDVIVSYFTPSYWFVFVYIAMYLVSPYVSLVWDKLTPKAKKILIILMICLFSVYPMIIEVVNYYHLPDETQYFRGVSTIGLEGSQAGYTIVNFLFLYIIGCALRDKEKDIEKIPTYVLILLLIADIGAIFGWARIEHKITDLAIFYTTALNYENPLVILEAILFLLLFQRMNLGSSKIINTLAAASFPSYLIHINLLEYSKIEKVMKKNIGWKIFHMIGVPIILYLISFVLCCFYRIIFDPLFSLLSKKWTKHRKYSVLPDSE